jgi:hypothetical protein
MYPEDFDMARVVAREASDFKNQAAFFAIEQSIDALVRRKRWSYPRIEGQCGSHADPKPLPADAPVALHDDARSVCATTGNGRAVASG